MVRIWVAFIAFLTALIVGGIVALIRHFIPGFLADALTVLFIAFWGIFNGVSYAMYVIFGDM